MPAVHPYPSAGPETQWDGSKPDNPQRIPALRPQDLTTHRSTPSNTGSQSRFLATLDPK